MTEKAKNRVNRLGTIPFVTLWTLAYGLGWATLMVGAVVTSRFLPRIFESLPIVGFFILLGAVPGFISSLAQQWLIRWKFAVRLQRWWLWSTLAWVAGGVLLRQAEFINIQIDNPIVGFTVAFGVLFTIPALAQAWMLRKHVRRAWMWPAAAIASAATFAVPVVNSTYVSELWTILTGGFAGLLQGAVMGMTMVWLFGMARIEPLKRGLDTSRLEDKSNALLPDSAETQGMIESDRESAKTQRTL